jgi:hypothetical protein
MDYFIREILPTVEPRLAAIEEDLLGEQFGFRYVPPPFRDAVIRACEARLPRPLV